MSNHFFVLQLNDSFTGIWEPLASAARCAVKVSGAHPSASDVADAVGVIVAAGGAETSASSHVSELLERTACVVVVGTAVPPRIVTGIMKAGASDYFAMPDDQSALLAWLRSQLDRANTRELARQLSAVHRTQFDFSRIVGKSPGLRAAVERAERVIPQKNATVLLTGETGTGKGLFAQAIHYNSPRAAAPFVDINCAAMPATLLEAELFGYERGAFTDARASKPGLFEAAQAGTLFLDEISSISTDLQSKLLKVLEEKKLRRLGSVDEISIDMRIIAATSDDLSVAVRNGSFRADLFYRINVVPIEIPPLRERGDDLLLLVDHFVTHFAEEYGFTDVVVPPAAKRAMLAYDWPGNVRELRNAIERAVLLGEGTLSVEHLLPPAKGVLQSGGRPLAFPASMSEIEREAAAAMVKLCGGNKSAAAEALQISRRRLYSLLREVAEI